MSYHIVKWHYSEFNTDIVFVNINVHNIKIKVLKDQYKLLMEKLSQHKPIYSIFNTCFN